MVNASTSVNYNIINIILIVNLVHLIVFLYANIHINQWEWVNHLLLPNMSEEDFYIINR